MSAAKQKTRVLLVDDDRATRETFNAMLTLEGYDVRVAPAADVALVEHDAWHPDVMVLDFHMPFINGLGLLYRLRARDPEFPPVAIVTGDQFLDDEVLSEIRELGAEVRFKPLWLEDLLLLVGTLTQGF